MNYPEGTKYVGFLFDREGFHGPGQPLFSVEDAYCFCFANWRYSYEVRITDPEEEATVLHVLDGWLICPMPDGTLKKLPCEGVEIMLAREGRRNTNSEAMNSLW